MTRSSMSRRRLLAHGGSAVAGLSVLRVAGPTSAFRRQSGDEVIPWLDVPAENPVPEVIVRQLDWERLDSWVTPPDQFFVIKHYNEPALTEQDWRLEISGLVTQPMTLTLADLKARTRQEVSYTMECSGNSGPPFFTGGVGNATWAGTPLAPLLEEAGVLEEGIEVVFWGADAGEQTWREEITVTEQFARSMSLADAMGTDHLLAWEMNGEDLPSLHGYPLRLITPGWYGVANVKWLTRIEVIDRRYQGHFMARDYVTIREEERDGETVWTFTSVTHDRLKSAPARVTRTDDRYRVMGAAWGAPIASVDVRIDDGPWRPATLTEGEGEAHSWVFWSFDWDAPATGEHTVTSRATDTDGNVQPAPDDPFLAGKATFWESNGHITRRVGIA
ncbi:MAG: probable sulfite oxidase [uncultured Thermomicrobiales bacterium]|uniref:Probable sulfite oxidase n=1 Tax=uncultured Thermomicrobiales bacterium TaxID=1645740 RepID=A0A6J4V9E8_9BACT|nr:MAG: probable sulfite oxidase [uncultured Thermomicrobiales bacterium]